MRFISAELLDPADSFAPFYEKLIKKNKSFALNLHKNKKPAVTKVYKT